MKNKHHDSLKYHSFVIFRTIMSKRYAGKMEMSNTNLGRKHDKLLKIYFFLTIIFKQTTWIKVTMILKNACTRHLMQSYHFVFRNLFTSEENKLGELSIFPLIILPFDPKLLWYWDFQ